MLLVVIEVNRLGMLASSLTKKSSKTKQNPIEASKTRMNASIALLLLLLLQLIICHIQVVEGSQQSDADALCSLKEGIVNWPGSCDVNSGWNCSGGIATTYACGPGSIPWSKTNCIGDTVGEIDVSSCHFSGIIASEISALTGLYYLWLRINDFVGTIPPQISTLTGLFTLNLRSNKLTGQIPKELSGLSGLGQLYLFSNKLTGPITPQLSALSNLTEIVLKDNSLTGPLPYQYSTLTGLKDLEFGNNFLTGSIPNQYSVLKSLRILSLESNLLSGVIPSYVSTFTNLVSVYFNFNHFVGPVPDIYSLSIADFDVSTNFLTSTVPSSFYQLSSLDYLDMAFNNLHGDPFFFLGFPKINFINVSFNFFDSISISNYELASSYLYITPNLNYLDISQNSLSGSLPDNIGYVFPRLNLLAASDNCFESYIPESLCNVSNLRTLLLNKLGSKCASTKVSTAINTFSDTIVNSKHKIPSCLFQLASLQTMHLISNYLFGTLSEVTPNLKSLSLVGNLLFGSIPKSIQHSFNLTNLQLSLNRLSGTLMDDAFHNLPPTSQVQLYSNRLSGNIPSNLEYFEKDNLDILTGNLFFCVNDAPSNLKSYETYSCGSSSINFYQNVYIAVSIALVLGSAWFYLTWKRRSDANDQTPIFIATYFHMFPFPRPLFSILNSTQFLVTVVIVALFLVLFNLGMDATNRRYNSQFYSSYSTHFEEYGWTTAFTYVHGILPFVIICASLSVTLYVYLHYVKPNGKDERGIDSAADVDEDDDDDDEGGGVDSAQVYSDMINEPSTPRSASKDTSDTISMRSKSGFFALIMDFIKNAPFRYFIYFQIVNIIVITGVNTLYVLVENETYFSVTSRVRKGTPIALSIFKIIWANTFLVFMIKYGIRSKLSEPFIFGQYVFAQLYIYILVPVITVYFTDVNCFYYRFQPIPSIIENYEALDATLNCTSAFTISTNCHTDYSPTPISQLITPSWIYSYQCGSSILTNYIPAVLAKYTIAGIFLPALKLFLLSFPATSKIRNFSVVKILLQYTLNAMSGKDILDKTHRRHFRTYRYLSNTMLDIMMLFTFGVFCPFLTFIIVFSICANEIINHLQVGSFLEDQFQSMDSLKTYTFNNSGISKSLSHSHMSQALLKDSHLGDPTYQMQAVISAVHSSQNSQSDEEEENGSNKRGEFHATAGDNVSTGDNRLQQIIEAGSAQVNETFDKEKIILNHLSNIYLPNSRKLYRSMWKVMLLTILFFPTLILFDFIADVYTNVPGLIAVFVFWFVMLLLFYSRKRMELIVSYVLCCLRRRNDNSSSDSGVDGNSEEKTNRSSLIEMNRGSLASNDASPIANNNITSE